MSWQQHYHGGPAAKSVPSQQAGHSLDYSPDLHLKMSKKIAQLTKVRARGRGAHLPAGGCLRAPRPGPVSAAVWGGLASGSLGSNLGGMLATSICRRQPRGTAGFRGLEPRAF